MSFMPMCSSKAEMSWRSGGCHCGAIRFEVLCAQAVEVSSCNCSICAMTGYLHLIVEKQHFRLLKGEHDLTAYTFNTGTAKHVFCKRCGVKSFYYPRSHPDGLSVNYRCLDEARMTDAHVTPFDGQNWEDSIQTLSALSTQNGP
jgi:centromere protein V